MCEKCGTQLDNDNRFCDKCQLIYLSETYPDIPSAIWDIEPSDEMAAIYYEEFGH